MTVAVSTMIPDGKMYFQPPTGGEPWGVCLIDAVEKINEITLARQGAGDFAHITDFQAWVKAQGGPDLNRDQADWLMCHLREEYLRRKKSHFDMLNSLQQPG